MGMAASQARYLGLTARKTNVEYEGQQINQARTALANQSANTFNELLALEVPTAPSTQDYTTVKYSYTDGTITEEIEEMSQLLDDPDGYNYIISHYHYADVYTGIQNRLTNPQVSMGTTGAKSSISRDNVEEDADGNYTINGSPVTAFDDTNEEQHNAYMTISNNYPDFAKLKDDLYTFTGEDGSLHFTTGASLEGTDDIEDYFVESDVPTYIGTAALQKYDPTDSTQKAAYDQICKDWPTSDFANAPEDEIYIWEYQGQTRFACLSDLETAAMSAPNQATPTENQDKLTYYVAQDLNTKIEQQQKAIVDINEDGRIQSIRYEDSSATYAVSTKTETDQDAYQDAMNQYNYDMQVYEKSIADINAKTEKIQEQDRTLELRLRQLDTEQDALQTEMEAVQKVIEKNIESTFKTFE